MDITITIKTFQRKKLLWRLLSSIEKYYPQLPIIIVDDSRRDYKAQTLDKFKDLNIKYIVTKFDVGLSRGRNIALQYVDTEYFLLCDDDFEFDKRTNLELACKLLNQNNADIVGGTVFNIIELNSLYSILWTVKRPTRIKNIINQTETISIYNGYFNISQGDIELTLDNNFRNYEQYECYKTDIVSNFFIANTNSIKKIKGWQPEEIKVGEHQAFFLRAKKAGLKVLYTKKFGVKHYPYKSIFYSKYRFRSFQMQKLSFEMLGVKSYKTLDNNGKILFNYERNN